MANELKTERLEEMNFFFFFTLVKKPHSARMFVRE